MQLGYLPRVKVVHTSSKAEGQIYIPEINWMLMVACLALVLAFGSSTALAAAYGIAVTGTMSDHVVPVLPGRAAQLGLVARARRSRSTSR